MSLGLHRDCQRRLVERTAEVLRGVKVIDGNSLDLHSAIGLFELDEVLPNSGKTPTLLEYLGDAPVFEFMFESLASELNTKLEYNAKTSPISLTDIEGYRDVQVTARRLVADFESLPWEYSMIVAFPEEFGELFSRTVKDYQLGNSLRLFTPDDQFGRRFPLPDRDTTSKLTRSLMGLFYPDQWNPTLAHCQIMVSGFIPKWGNTPPLDNAVSVLKSFLGLGVALRLYKVSGRARQQNSVHFLIHRRKDAGWQLEHFYQPDSTVAELFNCAVFDDLGGKLDSDLKKYEWLKDRLGLIKAVFEDKERARKILLASEWFLDSHSGAHKLFSFVQMAIVLEILLGDKSRSDLMGLEELLGNRCAYLIAKGHGERELILQDFKKFYKIRSQIVHRGKRRLDSEESYLLARVRQMCCRVISKELELIAQDVPGNTTQ